MRASIPVAPPILLALGTACAPAQSSQSVRIEASSPPARAGIAQPSTEPGVSSRAEFYALSESVRRFAPVSAPPCTAKWLQVNGDVTLDVGGAHVTPPPELSEYAPWEPLAQVSYNEHALLVAHGLPFRAQGAASSKLWLVECRSPHRVVEAYLAEDADFSSFLTSLDSRRIHHSAGPGLVALDLSTLHEAEPKAHVVRPSIPEYRPFCWSGSITLPRYLPLSWRRRDQEMLVHSEAACGFEGDPESWPLLLKGITPDGGIAEAVPLSPVATVRAVGRELWVGDGERCEAGFRAPTSPGTLWRSRDAGSSWAAVQVHDGDLVPSFGIVQLEVRGDTLVALTSRCYEMMPSGGDVWWSSDRGRTWQQTIVNLDALPALDEAEGLLFEQIEILSARPLRVRAFREAEVWEARLDAGARMKPGAQLPTGGPWKRAADTPRPLRDDETASVADVVFRATERGLERMDSEMVVFRTLDYLRAFQFRAEDEDQNELGPLLPLRPVPRGWITGCHSRRELEGSGDGVSHLASRDALSVFGVSLGDTLSVRALPSVDSQVVGKLAPDESELETTGNLCRAEGQTWVQLLTSNGVGWANGRYLRRAPGVSP